MDIIQIFEKFPTQQDCIEYLEQLRWKDKPQCPHCSSFNTGRNQHRHRCYACLTPFSVTVNTTFHRTHLPLQKWFLAIILMFDSRKNLSALQLSRDIEVNKNTAWRMSTQIKKAMNQKEHRELLYRIAEMDKSIEERWWTKE